MASTGRKHGFESLEEMRLLVALDFLGASEVLSQSFRLDFEPVGGPSWHIRDFLALIGGGMWMLNVRPMELIKDEDAMKFAAAREVAAACGWRYSVVAGWRRTSGASLIICPRAVDRRGTCWACGTSCSRLSAAGRGG
ncbi:hypothetical protein ACFVXE_33535 [Streptomyces sp. NPDC058231]|uniref:hypothetical protein n=1 Tax=Streptomyces sp. NPDC058231 TaxID=3346392 RepID=UPI0036E31313